jgi:hypothetical protein
MLRSYRSIILAIAGLILIGAAPNKDGINQPNQAPSQNPVTDQLKDVVSAIKESNKSPQPDNGCKAGEDNRSSDLCAQWKAADAAKDAAWWTFFAAITTAVGVIIGFLTLFAAGFAAWYAKKAANETEKGARAALDAVAATNLANEIARETSRAWVFCTEIKFDKPLAIVNHPELGLRYEIISTVMLKNNGAALAKNVLLKVDLVYMLTTEIDPAWESLPNRAKEQFEIYTQSGRQGNVIAPNSELGLRNGWGGKIENQGDMVRIEGGAFYLIGHIQYTDHLGNDRFTRFAFHPEGDSVRPWDMETMVPASTFGDAT